MSKTSRALARRKARIWRIEPLNSGRSMDIPELVSGFQGNVCSRAFRVITALDNILNGADLSAKVTEVNKKGNAMGTVLYVYRDGDVVDDQAGVVVQKIEREDAPLVVVRVQQGVATVTQKSLGIRLWIVDADVGESTQFKPEVEVK